MSEEKNEFVRPQYSVSSLWSKLGANSNSVEIPPGERRDLASCVPASRARE